MTQYNLCNKCSDRPDCRHSFRQLGKYDGPSVIPGVLTAFVMPILAFIAALAVAQRLLARYTNSDTLQTVFALVMAFGAVMICLAIAKLTNRLLHRN